MTIALALGAHGCGGARPSTAPEAPYGPASEAPLSGESEQGEAAAGADWSAGQPAPPGSKEPAQWAAPPPRTEPTTAAEALSALDEEEAALLTALDEAKEAVELARDPAGACRRVCVAISSMRRSVDAVCRLAGESDARCERARGTLDRSEDRVRGAGCGCPAEPE